MLTSDLSYILIVQITIILLLLISFIFYFSGRDRSITRLNRIILGGFAGLIISFIYIFDVSHFLYFLIFVIGILTLYLGFFCGLSGLVLISIFQFIYYQFDYNLLGYFGLIVAISVIKPFIKDNKKIQVCIFILSFIFLNIDIWISKQPFLMINGVGFCLFVILLLIINKIRISIISQEEHKKLYYYDNFTKVKNYYCLLENSSRILCKKNTSIGIILINIDHMKDINNLYGIYFGNNVIKMVAESIQHNINEYGEVYRIDGDCFCIVSLENYKIIKTMCDRIRYEIDIKEVINDNNKINISVSIGAYCGQINSKNIDDYIELAQDALFQAKTLGKNKVIIKQQNEK